MSHAVASEDNTLDFTLGAKRECQAAAHFFRKVLKAQLTQAPRVVTVDKHAADPAAIGVLKAEEKIAEETELRQSKYLNNIVEPEHRNIKRLVKPLLG